MVRSKRAYLSPNGNGAQVYLGEALLGDTACPLDADTEATVSVVDGAGLLLAEKHDPREITVDVDDSTTPPTTTITLEPTEGTDGDW